MRGKWALLMLLACASLALAISRHGDFFRNDPPPSHLSVTAPSEAVTAEIPVEEPAPPAKATYQEVQLPTGDEPWLDAIPKELHISRRVIPESEDAWPLLVRAFAGLKHPSKPVFERLKTICYEGWHVSNSFDLDIEVWIDDNESALQELSLALQKDACQVTRSLNTELHHTTVIQISGMKIYLAAKELRKKRVETALNHVFDLIRLGDFYAVSNLPLLETAFGMIYQDCGIRGIKEILRSELVSEAELKRIRDALSFKLPPQEYPSRALRAEFCDQFVTVTRETMEKSKESLDKQEEFLRQAAEIIEEIGDEELKMKFSQIGRIFDATATMRLFSSHVIQLIESDQRPWSEKQQNVIAEIEQTRAELNGLIELMASRSHLKESEQQRFLMVMSNFAGKVATVLFTGPAISGQNMIRVQVTDRLGTQIMAALKLYHIRYGKLPESLDHLQAHMRMAIPLDPYTQKAFRYDPTQKTLKSAGTEIDENSAKQLVWTLDFK